MSKLEILKCPACSSNSIKPISKNISECEYCGSRFQTDNGSFVVKESDANNKNSTYTNKTKIMLISTLALLLVTGLLAVQFLKEEPETIAISDIANDTPDLQIERDKTKISNNIITKPLANIPIIKNTVINPANDYNFSTEIKGNSALKIISQFAGITSNQDKYWIVTIKNQSQQPVARAGVVISLYDETGQRIEEQKGYVKRKILAPDAQASVLVLVQKAPKFAKAEFSTFAAKPLSFDKPYAKLEIASFITKKTKYSEKFTEIIGDVYNPNDFQVDYTKIVVLAKDEKGQTIGIADGYATHSSLKPKAKSGFKVTIGAFQVKPENKFEVYAIGQEHRE